MNVNHQVRRGIVRFIFDRYSQLILASSTFEDSNGSDNKFQRTGRRPDDASKNRKGDAKYCRKRVLVRETHIKTPKPIRKIVLGSGTDDASVPAILSVELPPSVPGIKSLANVSSG